MTQSQLTQSRHLAELFEKTADLCGNPKKAANWFLGETLRLLKERGLEEEEVEFLTGASGSPYRFCGKRRSEQPGREGGL